MTRATRPPAVRVLDVLLNERDVGTLTLLPDDRSLFTFHKAYGSDSARPVLSLSYKTIDGVATPSRPTRRRVPPFFSNLLPEGHLRAYLARQANVNPQQEFFLLWLLGKDLPGAVMIRSPDGAEPPPYGEYASTVTPSGRLRFSLAGVQLKFSAVLEADGRLTIPTNGIGGSWIVKLPSQRYDAVPEAEFAMMELARAVGITVPEVRLVSGADLANLPRGISTLGNALAVRRFDRTEDQVRVHTEDFAQVFGVFPDRKYERASSEDIARVLWAEAGLESVVEFARRLAFSVLIGNADMHLKNWSLIYEDGISAKLAPAYDLVPTVAYLDQDTQLALSLGGVKDMQAIDLDTFARFAARAGIPERPVVEAARETAARVRMEWTRHATLDVMPDDVQQRIAAHLQRVPL